MSHLHLPDGLLPLWLWLPALALVLATLLLSGRRIEPRRVAYQGALGAMMLAAMSVPLGPLDYHLALAGPVGVLLGPAASFQVVFVVTAILAFLGHGGFTAIGLNTLLLAGSATGAHLAFALTARRMSAPWRSRSPRRWGRRRPVSCGSRSLVWRSAGRRTRRPRVPNHGWA